MTQLHQARLLAKTDLLKQAFFANAWKSIKNVGSSMWNAGKVGYNTFLQNAGKSAPSFMDKTKAVGAGIASATRQNPAAALGIAGTTGAAGLGMGMLGSHILSGGQPSPYQNPNMYGNQMIRKTASILKKEAFLRPAYNFIAGLGKNIGSGIAATGRGIASAGHGVASISKAMKDAYIAARRSGQTILPTIAPGAVGRALQGGAAEFGRLAPSIYNNIPLTSLGLIGTGIAGKTLYDYLTRPKQEYSPYQYQA